MVVLTPMAGAEKGLSVSVEHHLAVYGSLGPGRPNHHQLAMLRGAWTTGEVRGRLIEHGWGAALGYPGLVLAPEGEAVTVELLSSVDLPNHWARLDAFEGAEYRRVVTTIVTAAGDVGAYIYVLADAA
jgi:gamma-glutamylcyclotransferase (GGCT)/AIG2-like uncharacterized protein YtfP